VLDHALNLLGSEAALDDKAIATIDRTTGTELSQRERHHVIRASVHPVVTHAQGRRHANT